MSSKDNQSSFESTKAKKPFYLSLAEAVCLTGMIALGFFCAHLYTTHQTSWFVIVVASYGICAIGASLFVPYNGESLVATYIREMRDKSSSVGWKISTTILFIGITLFTTILWSVIVFGGLNTKARRRKERSSP